MFLYFLFFQIYILLFIIYSRIPIGHHFKVGAAALKGLKVEQASSRRKSSVYLKHTEDDANMKRRMADLRRTSEQMQASMSLSIRRDTKKGSQHQHMETVLVEGMEVPAVFFANDNFNTFNTERSKVMPPNI